MKRNQSIEDIVSKRTLFIRHAKVILEDDALTGVEISKETGVHISQVYAYRNKTRPIENAKYENLWKFEKLYQEHNAFKKYRNKERELR